MTKFQTGKRLRHARSMDVDIVLLDILEISENGVETLVKFVSQNTSRFIAYQVVMIVPEQYDNWAEVANAS